MILARLFLGAFAATTAAGAVDPASVAVNSPPTLAGPYLTPPMPPAQLQIDSAELVPPVKHADSVGMTANPPMPEPGPETADAAPAPAPTDNVTVNLIQLMVKRGLLTKDDASGLVRQAQEEASDAKAHEADAKTPVDHPNTGPDGMLTAPSRPGPGDDSVGVAYVPDVVRNQIRDEVTADVMQQARHNGLVEKNGIPEWVHRFRITGDVRLRYEDDSFPDGNAVGSGFINFNAINTSANGLTVRPAPQFIGYPQFDINQERDRFRLRARIGTEVDLGDRFTAGLRIATGSDNSPVTENQTIGGVNSFTQGQGGNFSKYQIWLDRAYLRWEYGADPDKHVAITLGRFDNPFFHSEMIYANDLGFDGAVIQARYKAAQGVVPYLTFGAFPVFNTDLNFSTYQASKFKSEDKYLFGTQLGTNWKINKDFSVQGAVAFYDFENIEGQVSDPIPVSSPTAVGSTDDSRPSFAQNGNTYIALRNFADVGSGGTENQFFGLASQFRELVVTGQLDFSHFDPFHMALKGEIVKNVAFDRNAIVNGGPANFSGPQNNTTDAFQANSFNGGDTGYFVSLTVGKVVLQQFGDWNIFLTYRYVESDATVDAFTDADFGATLVGTNLQGFTIGGDLALAKRVSLRAAFMSADSIAGPTYHNDLFQFDINASF